MTDLPGVRIALTLILGLLAFPTTAAAAREARIIVARDAGLTASERADIRSDAGVTLAERLPLANTEVVTAAAGDARAALRRLNADPDVRYAELDRAVHAFTVDPWLNRQWALRNTGQAVPNATPSALDVAGTVDADMDMLNDSSGTLADAWSTSTGEGHTVAVVDSGVDGAHPDLSGQLATGLDWVGEDAAPADENGHGTHVTGIIAALKDNSIGIAGVAPSSRVLPLRVLDGAGNGSASDVAAAFALAAQLDVRVVNVSLGADSPSQAEQDAIAAGAADTLFVVAAGNDAANAGSYPCRYPADNILCVGASTQTDTVAGFSNRSAQDVDVFAPGDNIVSTWLGNQYSSDRGTSMAAPQVAGLAALLLEKNPGLTPAEIKAKILGTVDQAGAFSDSASGGRVNAAAALAAVAAPAACTVNCTDPDGDGVTGLADACPYEAGTGPDGCIAVTTGIGDADGDGKIDRFDACPATPGRPSDGCPDGDGDGVADHLDACPAVAGSLPNGCSPPVPPPPSPPDADGDGRTDALDACPHERAATPDGCPVPVARSLAVKIIKWSRRVTLRVRTDRAATATFEIQRRVCDSHGRKCRWKRVATRRTSTVDQVASFTKRLARGSYRGAVTLSSSAGSTAPTRRSFRVR